MSARRPSEPPGIRPWPGYFIAIEGIDGTGKTTLAASIGALLDKRGVPALLTYEPTRGPHGLRIRELAKTGRDAFSAREEADLFIADRREHLKEVILPSLQEGHVVIVDRYLYSTLAYQGAHGVDPEQLREQHRAFAPEPDLLVILELDVESAIDRIRHSRGDQPDRFFESSGYLRAVADIFSRVEHPNLIRLDATLDRDELAGRVIKTIEPWIASTLPSPPD